MGLAHCPIYEYLKIIPMSLRDLKMCKKSSGINIFDDFCAFRFKVSIGSTTSRGPAV